MTMVSVTAHRMDGETYSVEIDAADTVQALKEALACASGVHSAEVTILLLDASTLDDDAATVGSVLLGDAPEVVIVRTPTVGTRALAWYDRWVEASASTRGDGQLSDADAWVRLGAALYSLGEYQTSWNAYRQAAFIGQGLKAYPSDADMLEDPLVGKCAGVLDRAFKRHQWLFTTARTHELLRLLALENRIGEIATNDWDTLLPNSFSAVRSWFQMLGVEDHVLALTATSRWASSGSNRLVAEATIWRVELVVDCTLAVTTVVWEEPRLDDALNAVVQEKKKPKSKRRSRQLPDIGDDWDQQGAYADNWDEW